MKKLFAGFVVSSLLVVSAQGSAFTLGNLVVVQVGTGAAALNNTATAASLLEYSTLGSLVQSVNLPTALTLSGTATSEGFLTLSANGQYLMMGGYNAAPGTAGVATAAPTVVNRVVARIDLNANIDTTTALADAYSGSNIRSAVSTDGINIWTSGNGGSGLGATAGPRFTTFGSTTSVRVDTTASNMRVANIYNGQLYVSSATGTLLGISTVGTGLPTAASSVPITILPGMPTSGTHSPYDFWFKDANTLYVADDGAVASGGGIQKWAFDGTTWSLVYTLLNNGTTTTGARGLTGTVDGSGNAVLFATTSTASANSLIMVTDIGASSTANILATAAVNTVFRGVELLPVPEPSSVVLGILGGFVCLLGLRRKA